MILSRVALFKYIFSFIAGAIKTFALLAITREINRLSQMPQAIFAIIFAVAGAIRIKSTGLMAEALEHEIDHLNGVLYIDHIEDDDNLYKIEQAKKTKPDI